METMVKPLYVRKDAHHGWQHIMRIRRRAREIAKGYADINKKRLRFLIYFHGLKPWVIENRRELHEKGFDATDIQALLRHTKNPKTIEEQIVHDANLLDNVGRSGIRKCFAVGETLGRTRMESIRFMQRKLKKIQFYTKEGKRIGFHQINIMRDFLRREQNKK